MKMLFAVVSILALAVTPACAETLDFPNKGDLLFRITIPDDWEPDQDDDEVVEATSPDEHLSLSIWELDSKDDAENIEQELKDQLKDHAKKIKIEGKPQAALAGGLDTLLYKGTALDTEDDEPIDFFALVITTKTRAAVVFIEADREAPEEEVAQLDSILKSITPRGGKKVLRAALALNKHRPTKKFTTEAPQIYAFYVGLALTEGDELKGVWLADDVGDAAPKNSKIGEASIKAKSATDTGAFSLSKPTNGWPPGKYRIEISVNEKVVEKLRFTIAEP